MNIVSHEIQPPKYSHTLTTATAVLSILRFMMTPTILDRSPQWPHWLLCMCMLPNYTLLEITNICTSYRGETLGWSDPPIQHIQHIHYLLSRARSLTDFASRAQTCAAPSPAIHRRCLPEPIMAARPSRAVKYETKTPICPSVGSQK